MFRKIKSDDIKTVIFFFNKKKIYAFEGETIASALLRSGVKSFRVDNKNKFRGPYCMLGSCFECLVNIDDSESQQACQILVRRNLKVKQHEL